MSYGADRHLVECLRTRPEQRTLHHLATLYSYLRKIEGLAHLRESTLRSICQVARYAFFQGEQILYSKGDTVTDWYILLSGSVFIQGTMYLSRNSFGKAEPGMSGRPNDCLILEPSEMMVIDEPQSSNVAPAYLSASLPRRRRNFSGGPPQQPLQYHHSTAGSVASGYRYHVGSAPTHPANQTTSNAQHHHDTPRTEQQANKNNNNNEGLSPSSSIERRAPVRRPYSGQPTGHSRAATSDYTQSLLAINSSEVSGGNGSAVRETGSPDRSRGHVLGQSYSSLEGRGNRRGGSAVGSDIATVNPPQPQTRPPPQPQARPPTQPQARPSPQPQTRPQPQPQARPPPGPSAHHHYQGRINLRGGAPAMTTDSSHHSRFSPQEQGEITLKDPFDRGAVTKTVFSSLDHQGRQRGGSQGDVEDGYPQQYDSWDTPHRQHLTPPVHSSASSSTVQNTNTRSLTRRPPPSPSSSLRRSTPSPTGSLRRPVPSPTSTLQQNRQQQQHDQPQRQHDQPQNTEPLGWADIQVIVSADSPGSTLTRLSANHGAGRVAETMEGGGNVPFSQYEISSSTPLDDRPGALTTKHHPAIPAGAHLLSEAVANGGVPGGMVQDGGTLTMGAGGHHHNNGGQYKRSSRMSDTSSSLYSGSMDDPEMEAGHCDSLIDSDDEDEYSEATAVRDAGRECLEKDPSERTEDDIETLLDFMQNFQAFANMTMATRRSLCAVMVFAVVEPAGTIVMNDGEELDSWSIILNGTVQIAAQTEDGGESKSLTLGDSFGITHPTMDKLYHKGVMKTVTDDCQFVCIAQKDYYDILSQGEENVVNIEEYGKVVLVLEKRSKDKDGGIKDSGSGGSTNEGAVVIRGTPERLIRHLVATHSLMEVTYVEDFLLMYRAFLNSPLDVANQLLQWFKDETYRDKVTRVVLLWVNNHFNDFEANIGMSEFLQQFEDMLEEKSLLAPLKLLHIACHAKARPRTVTITRGTRDELLRFAVIGGRDRNCGIFISSVERDSKAYEGGLKRGDQILEVNGQNMEHSEYSKAMDIMQGTTHLHITFKSNFLHFREIQTSASSKPNVPFAIQNLENKIRKLPVDSGPGSDHPDSPGSAGGGSVGPTSHQPIISAPTKGGGNGGSGKKGAQNNTLNNKFKRALEKMKILPSNKSHNNGGLDVVDTPRPRANSATGSGAGLQRSNSSPDLPTASYGIVEAEGRGEFPEQVLKIYRADQTSKYFFVHKETSAGAVVISALRQFGISEHSSHLQSAVTCNNYSLCEVSVDTGGLVKQKRLPDNAVNLMDRMAVNARYYLKNNMSQESLVVEEAVQELMKETHYTLLHLSPAELAAQLSLADHGFYRDVEATEYVDDLYKIDSPYGHRALDQFAELVNKEMFWVVTEVCMEPNAYRRMRIIKHFVKIARYCKDTKNFNSMFAIVSGLGHGAVTRLRDTWSKLPSKYHKAFEDLQGLMNPTRNMAKYRSLLATASQQPPVIPFFPIIKKDLTFIHLGNDTKVEGLINFEKMRMIAKEVRHICNVASAVYKPSDLIPATPSGSASVFSGFSGSSSLTGGGNPGMYTVRKKKRSSTIIHPKRMYEEAMMARRVKAFLATLKIEQNEDRLAEISCTCEPNRRGELQSSVSFASDRSSTSMSSLTPANTGPKFGVDSPDGVRKLMALSEKSKTITNHRHDNVKRGLTSPLPQQKNNNNSSSLGGGGLHHTVSAGSGGGPLRSGPLRAVNLSAESSSLGGGMQRKASNASTHSGHSGSRTPSDASAQPTKKFVFPGGPAGGTLVHGGTSVSELVTDRDSGHCSIVSYDGASTSSVNSTSNSPPMALRGQLPFHAPPASPNRPPPPAYHAAVQKSQVYGNSNNPYMRSSAGHLGSGPSAKQYSSQPYSTGQPQYLGTAQQQQYSHTASPISPIPLAPSGGSSGMLGVAGSGPRRHPSAAESISRDQEEVVSAV